MVSRLKFERVNRGISCERLYRLSGVRPIDISLIERLRLIPTPEQLTKLSQTLGIPADVLLKPVEIIKEQAS